MFLIKIVIKRFLLMMTNKKTSEIYFLAARLMKAWKNYYLYLIRIPEKDICKNAQKLLLDGETVVGAYKTVRDQVVFTTHRIILVDMQGVTGTRQEIFVLPYRKILHYGIKTAGFGDPLQTSELTVCFADEHEAKFGFIGQEELLAVAQAISRCIL